MHTLLCTVPPPGHLLWNMLASVAAVLCPLSETHGYYLQPFAPMAFSAAGGERPAFCSYSNWYVYWCLGVRFGPAAPTATRRMFMRPILASHMARKIKLVSRDFAWCIGDSDREDGNRQMALRFPYFNFPPEMMNSTIGEPRFHTTAGMPRVQGTRWPVYNCHSGCRERELV